MALIVIVPGLAVRSYAIGPAAELRARGHEVHLLRSPAWHGAPARLERYGRLLAQQLDERGQDVSLLIGLSVGTQAAAIAAVESSRVKRLVLVSPTVDPRLRTLWKLLRAWVFAPSDSGDPGLTSQLPDWAHAGVPRIVGGFVSALRLPLEVTLPRTTALLTVVHADHDHLGSGEWAARLAADNHGSYMLRANAPHSWPVNDEHGFAEFVDSILKEGSNT